MTKVSPEATTVVMTRHRVDVYIHSLLAVNCMVYDTMWPDEKEILTHCQ